MEFTLYYKALLIIIKHSSLSRTTLLHIKAVEEHIITANIKTQTKTGSLRFMSRYGCFTQIKTLSSMQIVAIFRPNGGEYHWKCFVQIIMDMLCMNGSKQSLNNPLSF